MSPLEQLQILRLAVKAPRDLLERGVATARSALPLGRNLLNGGTSSLNGPIGPHRRFDRAAVSLQDVKKVRKRHGGSVNDVVLAAVASGFRELLAARGELAPETVVSTMVPVSVRAPGEQGGNRVSAVFARLPVGEEDPVRRLQDISGQMDNIKRRGDAVAGQALVSLQGFSPPMLPNVMRGYLNRPEETAGRLSTAGCTPATSVASMKTAIWCWSTAPRT